MEAKRNLVLGGSGAIGNAFVKYLEGKGEIATNLDLKEGFDLRDKSLENYKDYDFVWFFAWDVGGAKYLMNPKNALNLLNNNMKMCVNVFGFLEKYKIPFLFASSQMAKIDNTYGLTKIVGEEYCKKLGGKIVRFWNVYSWEIPSEKSHVIPDFVKSALVDGEINMMTTGDEERQLIHVDDCVRNLYKIPELEAQEYDLSNGKWFSIKELADKIALKTNAKVKIGSMNGYQNKVDPKFNHELFSFQIDLDKGLDIIIEQAKKDLKINSISH